MLCPVDGVLGNLSRFSSQGGGRGGTLAGIRLQISFNEGFSDVILARASSRVVTDFCLPGCFSI